MWNTKTWIDYTTPMSFYSRLCKAETVNMHKKWTVHMDFVVLLEQQEHLCLQCMTCETFVLLLWTFLRKEKGINTKKKLILKTCIRWLSLLYTNSKVDQMSYVSFAWWVKLTSLGYYKPLPCPSNLYGMLFKTDFWQSSLIPWPKSYGSVPADPPMWWFGYSSVLWPRSQCCCCEFQFVVGSPAVYPWFGCMTSFCSSQTLAVVLRV